jgi:hypothetical protein
VNRLLVSMSDRDETKAIELWPRGYDALQSQELPGQGDAPGAFNRRRWPGPSGNMSYARCMPSR